MANGETQNQLNIALRYAGTSLGTLFTILGALQFIPPEKVHDLTTALQDLQTSVITGYGALLKMWVILGPAAIATLTALGIKSGSIQSLGAKLLSMTKSGPAAEQAKQVLIASTIALPEVQTIVTDKKTADAAPSESVVAADAVKVVISSK